MAFVKERIPEADKELFNSFEICDHTFRGRGRILEWHDERQWVADREKGIYFTFVGRDSDENHTFQYDLIWKGKKIIVNYIFWVKDEPGKEFALTYNQVICTVVGIRAPKELQQYEEEMIEIIKSVIRCHFTIDIFSDRVFDNKSSTEFKKIANPKYFDEVK